MLLLPLSRRCLSPSLLIQTTAVGRECASSTRHGPSLLQLSRDPFTATIGTDCRHFSAMSKEQEDKEKSRVASLTPYQKEMELRDLDAKISRLNTLRGINTGELYTLRGKFKALARDYGIGFMVWYWTVWVSTAALTYGAIEVGDVDAIALLAKVDNWTGYNISTHVDPTLGTIGLTIAVNELLEPLRLPLVVVTTKPVVNFFSFGNRR